MDRLAEIEERTKKTDGMLSYDLQWMKNEIETLRQAAHADQVVIQRLRQEIDRWVAIAEDAQAKLARANHLAVSLTERVMR